MRQCPLTPDQMAGYAARLAAARAECVDAARHADLPRIRAADQAMVQILADAMIDLECQSGAATADALAAIGFTATELTAHARDAACQAAAQQNRQAA